MSSNYTLMITLGALLILGPLSKSLLGRIGVPALVGYIVLGFLLSILNQQWYFITPAIDSNFSALAQVGIVALLFRVGLKSHTRSLLKKLPDASVIWIGDVLTNLVLGFVVSRYCLMFSLETSLIIATAFSATSVAVSVSVWEEAGQLYTGKGQLLVDVAELDDLSGVLLLAILLAIIPILQDGQGVILHQAGAVTLVVLLKLALFFAGCYLFAHYVEADFTRLTSKWEGSRTGLTITILGAGLTIAAVAGYLGFSLAIGALFAGLAFSRDPEAVHTDGKFAYFYDLFTPFFFINIGMQMDPGALLSSLDVGIVLFAVAALGKFVGVAGPALLTLPKSDAILLGVSMIPRAEIALVIVYQCRQFGDDVISAEVFSGMVLVSLASSVFASLLLRRMLVKANAI